MEGKSYGVYVLTDTQGRVTAINSDAFLEDVTGWTRIDEGSGDRFRHAQGHYLAAPLMDGRRVYRYRLDGTALVERTAEEMDADAARIVVPPTQAERIAALEEQNEMLINCLLEMSEQVYA